MAKTELEDAGESTEGMVESTAKLRQEVLALSGVDIMLDKDNFKSTYQVMDELSAKWEELTDIQQASIIELMAGKHQGNVFASLMQNFDIARDALEVSANSAGSAMKEHEKWSQSLEAQLLKLQAAWQSLSQSFLKSDFLKVALDSIIGLTDGLGKLIDTFGAIPTLLTVFTAFKSLSGNGIFRVVEDQAADSGKRISNIFSTSASEVNRIFNNMGIKSNAAFKSSFDFDIKALINYKDAINSGINPTQAFSDCMRDASEGAKALAKNTNLTTKDILEFGKQQKAANVTLQAQNKTWSSAKAIMKEYNSGCKNTAMSQKDFVDAVSAGNSSLGKYLSGVKTGNANMKGYAASLVGATVKTVALEAATIALNTALTMGVSFLISAAISAISKWINAEEELAEKVSEVTSKYKEQYEELKKLKGNYDTSNESSMISRYEKLSKGVDNLGRNVSLTADEYSEYQSIVNNIASQIPSLVSGYDSQGNAILSCKGNVEELTKAYENLIHAQNQDILTNTGNIEKDFENTLKDAEKGSFLGMGKKVSTPSIELLEKVLNGNYSTKEIENLLEDLSLGQEDGVYEALYAAGIGDMGRDYNTKEVAETLAKQLETDKSKIKGIIDDYYNQFSDEVEEQKTIAQAVLSEAFDVSDIISGLDYGNISEELQSIAQQTISSLDYSFFKNLSESGVSVEQWTKEMLSQLNSLSDIDNKQIEAGFELQTKFNGGDISYGEYVGNLKNLESTIDGLNLKDEVKEQLKISVGLDDNGVVDQYDALLKRLTSKEIGLDSKVAKNFLDSLSAEELGVLVDIIPQLDADTTFEEIQSLIDEKMAVEFKFDITSQIEGVEAFNTALEEARSATGLTAESITALKGRYEDLEGFNAEALFERTANGVRVNNEELARLESQYENVNKLDIDKNLNSLIEKYQELTEEIKTCTDEQEKESLQLQADSYAEKIEELQILSSQYDGLTSAFSKWQNAQSSANDGDNYDSLYESLEGVQELYKKGLVGTDDFKSFAQLMSSKDLSTASVDEHVSAYKNGIKLAKRYFTEGQSGCKNFLNDISKLNSEWAHMNKDGSWEINFNAEEVAKELGTSVDSVLLIANKLRDYGFEVNLEDSSVDNLQTKIEKTEEKLKKLGQAPVDINVDIEANAENLKTIESEIEKAKSKISEINNSSVKPEVKTAQLEDARAKLEALIQKKQEASEPAFMNLDTSQVNASLVDALGKIQSYQTALNDLNGLLELKEAGITIDDSEIDSAKQKLDECAKTIQGLDNDVKVAIGLEEDGSVDSIHKSFEDGKVKIDADTDPAITKIEALAENVERIEDKDVTINVTVNGLDDVKELNKQINLATDIDGSIDKLSEYVEGAKVLSELDDNITSYVTANINGNVKDTPEFSLNNLKVFADGAENLKDIGSFTSNVEANISGNVKDTPEFSLNNLKVFSDSAKDLDDVGIVESSVTTDIKGNVKDTPEYMIDNLKVFVDSAKNIEKIGEDVKSKITADIKGNVKDTPEFSINNLKAFTDSAKDIGSVGEDVKAKITADIEGNVKDEFEYKIDNLKTFVENAKDIDSIGEDVKSKVTADVEGNVIDTPEGFINNLKTFTDSAKDVESIGEDVKAKVTADIDGNVIGTFESSINNLKVFTDSAEDIKSIGEDTKAKVTADVEGNVIDTGEYKINNLKVFTDSAEDVQKIGNVESKVIADVEGNVIDTKEYKIDNLKSYTDNAKDVKDIGAVSSKVTADVDGNVIDTKEYKIDNLKVYTDSAKKVESIGKVTSKVTADVDGNVIDTKEYKIDNLKVYTDSAKKVESIGKVSSKVTADVSGNVIDTKEYKIDNLKVYGESAKKVKDIGTVSSSVSASVNGNVINTTEEKIDNLGVFANNANKLKNTGNFSSSVSANVNGNVVTDDTVVTDLEHFASVVSGLPSQTVTVSVSANVDSEKINSAIDLLTKVANSGVFKDYNATVQVGATIATLDDAIVQNYQVPPKEGKVLYSVDPLSSVYTWTSPPKDGVVDYEAEVEALTYAQRNKTGTITYTPKIKGFPVVNGTANANGSAFANGTAYKQGDWGVKQTTTALTGELGQELIVYKNRFWTVGDNGAEFATIPKGAIVFNHKQTAELFANGRVTSDGGRGKTFAGGTAFVEGSAFVKGSGKFYNSATGASYGKSSSSSSSSSKSKSSDSSDDFEETIDWIETAIDRIERAIDQLDTKANSTYRSWSERNKALSDQINEVGDEITLQQKAYQEYMNAASGVGLDESYASKVRNGTIDIQTIKDETLKEKIGDYKQWYEKALDCKDTILELTEAESELFAQRFQNVQTQYDGILQGYEHTEAMLNEYISQAEEKGHIVSKKYYQALINNEKSNIAELKKQQADLIDARDEAVASGAIVKGSEAWIEQCVAIDEVTQEIESGTTALLEYGRAMEEIDWSVFDLIQERISAVSEEADFLIELMSNDKLFDDDGKLTSQGLATMGLHVQNYNTHMYQADDYGAEVARLDKQIAKDPYDQELINRRNEVLELQRESILAAEDEKEAICDMVEEGINLELDALQELIDKKNEELESERDLYEYQKKVKEQTEEIASLEKQMAAYQGDDSEEAKQKIQQIKVDLETARQDLQETEYDKYISDTSALLDTLYNEYELILNTRLDNIDALLGDIITSINAAAGVDGSITTALGSEGAISIAISNNATSIGQTLKTEVDAVGTKLSTAMSNIWLSGSGKAVIDLYGKDFQAKSTTTNDALNKIKADVAAMVDDVDKDAKKKVEAPKTDTSAKKNPTTTTNNNNNKKPTSSSSSSSSSSGDGKPKVGDKVKFVSGQYYYDSQGKKPLGSHYKGKEVYITNINEKSWATHPIHISTGKKLGSGDLGWLKLNQLSGYATGKKDFLNDEIAWTQEKGTEFIVRPSDGAILTPIAKSDSVLNAQASNNIWSMANNPSEFIKDNLNLGTAIPSASNVQNNYTQNIGNVVFDMQNVKNYNELISMMQKDKNFEKLILSMSIDRLAGKSSLAKNKSIR